MACANETEIDDFLEYKKFTFKTLNKKIDFNEFGSFSVRENEIFLSQAPMHRGAYTDGGYRFKFNKFNKKDNFFTGGKTDTDVFYDMYFFNSDTFIHDDLTKPIAEIYFRLAVDQVTHTRNVLTLMGFIASLGGVTKILLKITGWVIGGYVAFNNTFQKVAQLFRLNPDKNLEIEMVPENDKLKEEYDNNFK